VWAGFAGKVDLTSAGGDIDAFNQFESAVNS
jgi:hypothetical protein